VKNKGFNITTKLHIDNLPVGRILINK